MPPTHPEKFTRNIKAIGRGIVLAMLLIAKHSEAENGR